MSQPSEGAWKFLVRTSQRAQDIELTVQQDGRAASVTLTEWEARYLGRVLLQMGYGDTRHE